MFVVYDGGQCPSLLTKSVARGSSSFHIFYPVVSLLLILTIFCLYFAKSVFLKRLSIRWKSRNRSKEGVMSTMVICLVQCFVKKEEDVMMQLLNE